MQQKLKGGRELRGCGGRGKVRKVEKGKEITKEEQSPADRSPLSGSFCERARLAGMKGRCFFIKLTWIT